MNTALQTYRDDMAQLERIMDTYGLEGLLYAISDICADKAEHIRSNWQDNITARYWEHRHIRVTRAAALIEK